MNFDRQASADHAYRIVDAILIVDDEFLRQAIHYLASRGQLYGTSRIDCAPNIVMSDLAIAA